MVGNIYKGRVAKVLPGMQSSFVDIGLERDAFLYVSEVINTVEEFERLAGDDDDDDEEEDRSQKTEDRSSEGAEPSPSGETPPSGDALTVDGPGARTIRDATERAARAHGRDGERRRAGGPAEN